MKLEIYVGKSWIRLNGRGVIVVCLLTLALGLAAHFFL